MNVPIVSLKNVIPQHVIDEVNDVIRSGYWTNGPKVKQLEKEFAAFCGAKFCVAISNGTTALTSILSCLDIQQGDEILVPSFTFIASANSIKSVGAIPVFVEVDPITFTMDIKDIKQKITLKTKGIMPVHLYGLCANMDEINKIAISHDLIVIEDAAQAHGAAVGGKNAGNLGVAGAFSLYPTKNMFAGGEGGLITTNSEDLYNKLKLYINHGQSKKYIHSSLGYNFRLGEINATIALHSLNNIEKWNATRNSNAQKLNSLLEDLVSQNKLITPTTPSGYTHVFHQYTLKISNNLRDSLAEFLSENDIGYGIHYAIPVHKQPYYLEIGYENVSLPITEKLSESVISLPIHPLISEEQIEYISKIIYNFFDTHINK